MLLVTFIGLLVSISAIKHGPQDPCNGKRDGNYPIRDVFKYIVCKNSVSSYMTCQDNFVYVPGVNQCVNISTQSKSSFCKSRPDGDYNDPWNCNKFFKCYLGYSYQFDCQNLVFNPYTDQCVWANEYTCRQVSANKHDPQDPCNGKRDGNYPIRDVFKYIVCKNGISSYMTCQDYFVYVPGVNQCVNISTQSKSSFCKSRPDGDYNDPWNCNKFFKCYQRYSYQFDCQNLVFNPYTDQCVWANEYTCRQVSGLQAKKEIIEEQEDEHEDYDEKQGYDDIDGNDVSNIRNKIQKEIQDDLDDTDVQVEDVFLGRPKCRLNICKRFCKYGNVLNRNGCPTCFCKSRPRPKCGLVCAIYCKYGKVFNRNGCPTCSCKKNDEETENSEYEDGGQDGEQEYF